MALLNKAGFTSKRNLAKPYRPISVDKNGQPKPLETMRGHFINKSGQITPYVSVTNGTRGSLSTVGRGGACIIIKAGKGKRDAETGTFSGPAGKSKARPRKSSGGLSAKIGKFEATRVERVRLENAIKRYRTLYVRWALDQISAKAGEEMDRLEINVIRPMLSPTEYSELLRRCEACANTIKGRQNAARKSEMAARLHHSSHL